MINVTMFTSGAGISEVLKGQIASLAKGHLIGTQRIPEEIRFFAMEAQRLLDLETSSLHLEVSALSGVLPGEGRESAASLAKVIRLLLEVSEGIDHSKISISVEYREVLNIAIG